MFSFSFWIVFILLSIVAIPVAGSMDKRRLRAQIAAATSDAMSAAEHPVEALIEDEAEIEDTTASSFGVEPDGNERVRNGN